MKKLLTFLLILTTVCLIAAGCTKEGAAPSAVESVTVKTTPTKTEYVVGEEFDLTGGTVLVKYADGKEKIVDMTDEMCAKADTSFYGQHTVYINVPVDGAYYEVSFGYKVVFENDKVQQLADTVNGFCPLMEIEIEDIDAIRKAIKAYIKLSDENKAFIDESAPLLKEKLDVYERYALPVYSNYKKSQATEILKGVNPMLYTEGAYSTLTGYYNELIASTAESFDVVDEQYKSFTSRMSYIPKRNVSIEDLRAETAEFLKNRVKRDIYSVVDNGIFESTFESVTVDYSATQGVKAVLDGLANATIEDLDNGYIDIINELDSIFIKEFKVEAKKSLAALLTDWEKTADEKLSLWDKDAISLQGQFNNISISYDEDNRWWIPMPYRLTTIKALYEAKIDAATSFEELNEYYDVLAFEITRAVMERNIEMIYTIDRNLNKGYDRGDGNYWGYIANHWGASAAQAFVYDGIFDEYVGEIYGTSDSNPYRLVSVLYNRVNLEDILSLPERYNSLLKQIAPDPKAIVTVTVTQEPSKVIYAIGDEVSFAGGQITVVYNDLTSEVLEMDGESCEASVVDTSTPGSKTVTITVRTNGEEKTVQLTVTVKGDAKWDELINAISALGEASTIEDVKAAVEIYDAFGEDGAEFREIFAEDYNKLCSYQNKFIVEYSVAGLAESDAAYETMPYYAYPEQVRTEVDQSYREMRSAAAGASLFAEIDTAVNSFLSYMNALTVEQADVATVKAGLVQSLDRVATVTVYDFSSTDALNISITEKTVSLKDNAGVAALIEGATTAINSTADIEAAIAAYKANVGQVYDAVIEAYAAYATDEVKALVNLMRDTVKYVWENDGFDGNDNIPVDYTVDAWEYLWWTPDCYKVSVMLAKISVEKGVSKQFTYEAYQAAYFDMMRSVMYRNMYTVFQYKLSKGEDVEGFRWSSLSGANGAAGMNPFPYDGVLKDYEGQIITVEFRLWLWGYHKDMKVNTLAELLEKYIYDMDSLL